MFLELVGQYDLPRRTTHAMANSIVGSRTTPDMYPSVVSDVEDSLLRASRNNAFVPLSTTSWEVIHNIRETLSIARLATNLAPLDNIIPRHRAPTGMRTSRVLLALVVVRIITRELAHRMCVGTLSGDNARMLALYTNAWYVDAVKRFAEYLCSRAGLRMGTYPMQRIVYVSDSLAAALDACTEDRNGGLSAGLLEHRCRRGLSSTEYDKYLFGTPYSALPEDPSVISEAHELLGLFIESLYAHLRAEV